jgi:hypothetical protein
MREKPPLHARLRPAKAAKYLGISESTLSKMRVSGGGPQYIKLSGRVFYDTRDLDRWIESNKFNSTADYATAR